MADSDDQACLGCKLQSTGKLLSQLATAPAFAALAGQPPVESLYDFSTLSVEALALGESLDANNAICYSGINDWGAIATVVTGTAQQVLEVIEILNLSVSLQIKRELELAKERANECETKWSVMLSARLFYYIAGADSTEFGKIPAATINTFPDYTECRPNVPLDELTGGSRLAFSTDGKDLLAVANTMVESLLKAYYGGCRIREVNTTGVYIEDACSISKHWESYGLLVQSPDDIPLCSTGDVCIRNYYNTMWEWLTEIAAANPNRFAMRLNTFRRRYADAVNISVLPGIVVAHILLMGVVSLYQVMSHKRSILRKTSSLGASRCGLNDSCVLFTANLLFIATIVSIALGLVAAVTSVAVKNLTIRRKTKSVVKAATISCSGGPIATSALGKYSSDSLALATDTLSDQLTSFEQHCIGAPFRNLFHDCDDIAYITYNGKRCISVEALLLAGYLSSTANTFIKLRP
ncbi:unnamed protein product [Phytophthora lilii]|uniref:Unnamed protein product n=1 Tax=Phytophthora lilii TaxID=2077276 RepID=A0A9W6TE70_9STRA|nr:unnamed protein product [Phytophthora lilii]